jgi:hypothetical protein
MKKQTPDVRQLVYVVQDYDQQLCGVYTTLRLAAERYQHIVDQDLTKEEIETMIEEYGEEFRSQFERAPCIVVYRLDTGWIWSYDSLHEIKHALEGGEQYD